MNDTRTSICGAMTDATQKLIETAQVALVSMGMFTPGQICDCAHHSPKNRHALGDVCPVALQFVLDYDNLRTAIAAARQEVEKEAKTQQWARAEGFADGIEAAYQRGLKAAAPEVRAAEPMPRTYDQGVADERERCWRVAMGPGGLGDEESYWGRTIAEAILNTGNAHDSRIGRPTLDAQEQLIELIRERPLIALDAAIEALAAAPQPPKETT